jgi:hypothetical protein
VTAAEDRWVQALNALEAHVLALHATAPAGDERPAFTPPDDLGPLPSTLAAHASALLAECRRREEDLAQQMSRVSAQIEHGHQIEPEHRSTPMFVDTSL